MANSKQKTRKKLIEAPQRKRGAPKKHESKKIRPDHLRQDQWERACDEAAIRNIPAWAFLRDCLDAAFTSLDTKRGDVEASKMFDDKYKEGGD